MVPEGPATNTRSRHGQHQTSPADLNRKTTRERAWAYWVGCLILGRQMPLFVGGHLTDGGHVMAELSVVEASLFAARRREATPIRSHRSRIVNYGLPLGLKGL